MKAWLVVALAAAVGSTAFDVAAQGEEAARARLTYRATEPGCPDETSFRDLVAARLGYDPFDPAAKDEVTVAISPRLGGLEADLQMAHSPGPPRGRVLRAGRHGCAALATAMATSIAIAFDAVRPPPSPGDATEAPGPVGAAATPVAPRPVVAPAARDAGRSPPRTAASPWTALAFVGTSGSAALGPAPMLGADVGIAVRARRLSVEAAFDVETTLGAARVASGDRVDASVLSGVLVPCEHFGAFATCALARLGSFQGTAAGVTTPSARGVLHAALGVRGAYTLRLSDALAARGAVDVGFPVVRTSLIVDGRQVWLSPPAFASLSIALVAKIL